MRTQWMLMPALALLLGGCAVTYEQYQILEDPDPGVRRFVSTHHLQKGLSRAEAAAALGKQVIVGYEMSDSLEGHYKPIVKDNPQRVQNLHQGRHVYVVEFYFVGINQSDGEITDDEMTPLVFEQNHLIGWGWDFLNKLKE